MVFVVVGCLLLALKFFEYGPVAAWPWWLVLAPFGLAVLWWWYADASGWTKRREMDRMEERKTLRRRSAMERLGLRYTSANKADRRAQKFLEARQREIDKIEGKRADQRAKNRESILGSRFDSQQDASRPGNPKP